MKNALKQFHEFKTKHPEYVLFFREGDFYEAFHDDAEIVSRVCGTVLESSGIPTTSVPFDSVEIYLRHMIDAGHRVAICEQSN